MPAIFVTFWILATLVFWIGCARDPATAVLAAVLTAAAAFVLLRAFLRNRAQRGVGEPSNSR